MTETTLRCPNCKDEFVEQGQYDDKFGEQIECPECGWAVHMEFFEYISGDYKEVEDEA